jgi:hypothetical protein
MLVTVVLAVVTLMWATWLPYRAADCVTAELGGRQFGRQHRFGGEVERTPAITAYERVCHVVGVHHLHAQEQMRPADRRLGDGGTADHIGTVRTTRPRRQHTRR